MADLNSKPVVVDAHLHLYDSKQDTYPVFERADRTFEALVGDYAVLPRVFGLQDYAALNFGVEIGGLVWHEFISTDPLREIQRAQKLADCVPVPMAIVGLVDFASSKLEESLDAYEACTNVAAVRQHLAWDPKRPERRLTDRGDWLRDPAWQRGLSRLRRRRFRCSLEVFSPQLPDLLQTAARHSEVGFNVALMGWALDPSPQTFGRWKDDITNLAKLDNVRCTVSGLECVFGMEWRVPEAQPWFDVVLEAFGSHRVMIGSHSPIATLAKNFPSPYDGYLSLISHLKADEQRALLFSNAKDWYFGQIQQA